MWFHIRSIDYRLLKDSKTKLKTDNKDWKMYLFFITIIMLKLLRHSSKEIKKTTVFYIKWTLTHIIQFTECLCDENKSLELKQTFCSKSLVKSFWTLKWHKIQWRSFHTATELQNYNQKQQKLVLLFNMQQIVLHIYSHVLITYYIVNRFLYVVEHSTNQVSS